MDIESPAIKRPRISEESSAIKRLRGSEESSRKVGIVAESRNSKFGNSEVRIYVLDIDRESEDEHDAVAALQINFPIAREVAVCLLKSTVYVFGGYNIRYSFDCIPKPPDASVKFAKKYDLHGGKRKVEENDLSDINLMRYPKNFPIAIPTPDEEKILVFSENLFTCNYYHSRVFELYDPRDNSWTSLPELPGPPRCRHQELCICGEVRCYSFVDESHFFVHMEKLGSFMLDLGKNKWSRVGIPIPPVLGSYFVTAKGEYVLSACGQWFKLADGGFLSYVEMEEEEEEKGDGGFEEERKDEEGWGDVTPFLFMKALEDERKREREEEGEGEREREREGEERKDEEGWGDVGEGEPWWKVGEFTSGEQLSMKALEDMTEMETKEEGVKEFILPRVPLSTYDIAKEPLWQFQFKKCTVVPLQPFITGGGRGEEEEACWACVVQLKTSLTGKTPYERLGHVYIDVCHSKLEGHFKPSVTKRVKLLMELLPNLQFVRAIPYGSFT